MAQARWWRGARVREAVDVGRLEAVRFEVKHDEVHEAEESPAADGWALDV